MTPSELLTGVIPKAYALLPARMKSGKADVQLIAIALQESRLTHRRQIGGPAVGFWQFEKGGGVKGVLTHPASRAHASQVCGHFGIADTPADVYETIPTNDVLAACFARLLLWTDSKPLPTIGETQAAWDCYIRNWRPGKPRRQTWDALYAQAVAAVRQS